MKGRWLDLTADEIAAKSAANRKARTPMQGAVTGKAEAPGRNKAKLPRTKKPPRMSEKAVQSACMDILEAHPRVAFWWRQNTGAVKMAGKAGKQRYVRFSFKGASDLMAVLEGGKFLAVECKATGKLESEDQRAFLRACNKGHAYGLCIDDPQFLSEFLGDLRP